MRIGIGYDVHRLVEGRKLVLGGVEIPFSKGLWGHSDADVLIHAICDAILGALGEGDIGKHFPDSLPEYKDISSTVLLQEVIALAHQRHFQVGNLDAVIIAEQPRLADYIEKMREIISHFTQQPISRINIKAKKGEGLGFVGKEEGIEAQAVVILYPM
ncbi:MAG TPA: 2-C-methyl-D-erythritol 2,4-cyclodiphosphate synthase [Candidatus Limnocylindrales bacterium]|nr:2-C-methyl-D-erythritol 2,4-cyclodiphosphate synthase [Candidatus Limnocylindrales bacterium]